MNSPKKAKPAKGTNVSKRPVDVISYFKKGKRVSGYKRRKAGDANTSDSKGR